MEGLAPYVVGASFNAVGQPKGLSLGDGVIQTHYGYYGYNYEGWQDAYDTAPSSLWHIGRLYRITATAGSSAPELLEYSHDAVGNVTNVFDLRPGSPGGALSYGYDHLDRLTSMTLQSTGVLETYGYNEIGNLLSKGGSTYSYPQAGTARPHAVTAMNGSLLCVP